MQVAIDPAELTLAGRPIAANGMNMAVDETGGECCAFGIDGGCGSGSVYIFFFTHSNDTIADSDYCVGVEDGVGEVSAEQQADIADDQLGLWHRFRWIVVGHDSLPGAELLRTQWR